jgi:hypothetical protein
MFNRIRAFLISFLEAPHSASRVVIALVSVVVLGALGVLLTRNPLNVASIVTGLHRLALLLVWSAIVGWRMG